MKGPGGYAYSPQQNIDKKTISNNKRTKQHQRIGSQDLIKGMIIEQINEAKKQQQIIVKNFESNILNKEENDEIALIADLRRLT